MKILKLIIGLSILCYSCKENIELPENIREPSQQNLDDWKDEILKLEVWNGNIFLDGSILSNYDAFQNIKEINGSLTLSNLREDFINVFPNLTKINGNDETGDGALIETSELQELNLGKLESVCSSLSIANSNSLNSIKALNLQNVSGWFAILDNHELTYLDIPSLNFVYEFILQRVGETITINGAQTLNSIPIKINIICNKLEITENSFSTLSNVGFKISILVEENSTNWNWLESMTECPEIAISGPIQGDKFCGLKEFALLGNGEIIIRNTDNLNQWNNDWIISNCN